MTETQRRAPFGPLGPMAKAHWAWLIPSGLFPVALLVALSAYFLSGSDPVASAAVKYVCMAWPLLGIWLYVAIRKRKLSILDAWVFGALLPFLGMVAAGILVHALFNHVSA